jgi:hypothetical protein
MEQDFSSEASSPVIYFCSSVILEHQCQQKNCFPFTVIFYNITETGNIRFKKGGNFVPVFNELSTKT